jgi:hypothetical protein
MLELEIASVGLSVSCRLIDILSFSNEYCAIWVSKCFAQDSQCYNFNISAGKLNEERADWHQIRRKARATRRPTVCCIAARARVTICVTHRLLKQGT